MRRLCLGRVLMPYADRERRREYDREYHRERMRSDPAYRERHRERKREYQRERRRDPAYLEREREREREHKRERRSDPAYRERERERDRERKRENGRADLRRRRARKANAPTDNHTPAELVESWDERGLYVCTYCGGPHQHIDHVVPLSRGGGETVGNLVPACSPCNLSKGARLPCEWRPELTRTPREH